MSETPHPIPAAWLSAYYDGELDAGRRQQLEAHLPGCVDCQQELAALKSLSQALSADELVIPPLDDAAAFWRSLKPQLPDRAPASQPSLGGNGRHMLLRWAPGIGLLFLNGMVEVAAVVGTIIMLVASRLSPMPAWASTANWLAADASLGWLAWVLPAAWSGVGMFALFVIVSAGLAVLYLAWLGYELRYGAPAVWRTAA